LPQRTFITKFQDFLDLKSPNLELYRDSCAFREGVSARELTTMGIGGHASLVFESQSSMLISKLMQFCGDNQVCLKFIGNGSNLVFPDNGLTNTVLINLPSKLSYQIIKDENIDKIIVKVSAGSPLIGLSRDMTNLGYAGLEFAAGIPGSIGGAARMNAGAHGKEFGNLIRSVEILTKTGSLKSLNTRDISFSYRSSSIPNDALILNVELELNKEDVVLTKARRVEALNYRKLTQPLTMPSSGSVFKNPIGDRSAGKLLEDLGFKAKSVGGVMFSDLHANWIVRTDEKATTSDLRRLVNLAKESVFKEYNISLTEEIIFWESAT